MRQRDDLVFPMAEFERRIDALRERTAARGADAVIVAGPENITYLTGYQTTGYYYFQAVVVPVGGEPFMVTRLLEDTNVEARTWVALSRPYHDTEEPVARLAAALAEFGLANKRLGYEKHCYFFRATEQEALFAACPDATFVDCSGLVEQGRVVKSEPEIAIMRRAAAANEAGMRAGIAAVEVGASENDVAAEVHHAMFRAGGEYPACSPFVASGPRCAIGHATWEGRTIEAGETVFLEIGGCVQRYHTAMMRNVFLGEPTSEMIEAEGLIQQAVEACMAAMKPGAIAGEIDALSRSIFARNSFGAVQTTRSGYSIGIAYAPDWGEGHILSLQPDDPGVLEANMTFHLIPWIQIPGKAGIGLSETVRVTPTGGESLFSLERRLFVK
ncbi:MAG: M24 family metallopeptidase [Alphaproteobacteria bacterium]